LPLIRQVSLSLTLTRFTTCAPEHVQFETPTGAGAVYVALNGVAAPSVASAAVGALSDAVTTAAARRTRLKCAEYPDAPIAPRRIFTVAVPPV
jgi:hypothetical protein